MAGEAGRKAAELAARRAFVATMKDKPCMDCGVQYPSCVMEWDHRPGEIKLFTISQGVNRGRPLAELLAEIAKCDLVCANCHRIRTHITRKGTGSKASASNPQPEEPS
jgi:hypothetical protein